MFFVSFINLFGAVAQDNYPACINPVIINYPIIASSKNDIPNEIYYQPEDEYTYWYKLIINADCKMFFELSTISKDDDYDMMIYKYQGNNLCNDIVQKKETPFLNKTKGEITVKKGEAYYLSILHLNGAACGHILTLKTQNKETKIKAIHNDCVEEVLASIIKQDSIIEVAETVLKPVVEIPDSIVILEPSEPIDVLVKTIQIKLNGIIVNKNTQKQIEAELSVLDFTGNLLSKVKSSVEDGFEISNLNEKQVIVSINNFGYEPYIDTIIVDATPIKIGLNPIKVGEKIIMNKIYFYPNSYALKEESTKELLKLNKFMFENSQYSFEIQGHTNGNKAVKKTREYENLGEEWNFTGSAKKLSKLRADKIKEYLVKNGVQETQLQTIGYGGDRMIIEKPKNMKQAMQNIRVEIIVLK